MSVNTAAEAAPPALPAVQRVPEVARLWRWTGQQLDPRRNSLNLLRLTLALFVIFHHAYPLGGFAGHPSIDGIQLGGWAVFGFFCISGYLITESRQRTELGRYLVHRAARIYPAFWVCLVVVAVVFAPLAFLMQHRTINGYLTTGPITPIDYFVQNFTLRIGSYGIGTTIAGNPYPSAWNGSLWTLYYEFICYVLIGLVATTAWWRRTWLVPFAAFVASVAFLASWPTLASYVGSDVDLANLSQLLPFFLAGSLLSALRKHLPLHWIGGALSVGVMAGFIALSPRWGLQAAAPFLAYLLIWLGQTVPAPDWFRRNDLSYGVYIYAFAVQQLLAAAGLPRFGLPAYIAVTIVLTVALAAASWFVVERPVMRRARR